MAKVAIGIPTYNAERYIAETIESVLNQTFTDWELHIQDDGSKDATGRIVEEYAEKDPRIRFRSAKNVGPSEARNQLFRGMPAETPYVVFLDHDDRWQSQALEWLVGALEADETKVLAHGVARYIDPEGNPFRNGELETWCRERQGVEGQKIATYGTAAPTTFSMLALGQRLPTVGVALVRRAAFEKAGDWSADLPICADWEMWLRLSMQGDFAFVDRLLLDYRQHPGNLSGNHRQIRDEELRMRRRMLNRNDVTEAQRQRLEMGFRLSEREKCRWKWDFALKAINHFQWKVGFREILRGFRNYLFSVRGLSWQR